MLQAKKSLGQNFLINPHILEKIVSAAEISKDDIVLEIGPGTGNLTKELARKAGKVIAIEKDRRLIEYLKNKFSTKYAIAQNVEVIEGDILKLNIRELFENCKLPALGQAEARPGKIENSHYKVVSNIPYYITSHLLREIFEKWPAPKLIVLMVQKEVAQRIIAKPPHMNLLALSVQYYSEPEIIGYISKNNFRPVPKVDSAIIKLVLSSKYQVLRGGGEEKKMFELMKAGFSEKRKQLAGTLSKKLKIDKEKIQKPLVKIGANETARPEVLSLNQWQKLNKSLSGE